MSWLRSSPLRSSFAKQRSRDSPPKDADPVACYDSFRKHWQQSHDIIRQSNPPNGIPNQDDVLGIVNHVDQMITLLLLELRDYSVNRQRHQNQRLQQKGMVAVAAQQLNSQLHPCLEYLLSENLLHSLYEWSLHTGRFGDAVRLEQLKLYELLVSHDSSLLAHEPVTRPLLRLLDACVDDIMPVEVQKKLVMLLNQVCVALVQNTELLGLFFRPSASGKNRFIIFTLLVPYIHREGSVGQQARDAMLLCMSLSKKNDEIGNYIAEESHICSLLATGLGALYSVLPRTLDVESADWHRLTVDDINDLPSLTQLMNSLEFCNAVAQVVHPLVQKQLSEFIYRGFLVPVIGPALLQESIAAGWSQQQQHQKLPLWEDLDSAMCRTTVEELVAATAYFDLFLRSVTEPGLLKPLIKFLLEENYDDNRILDHLIRRISSQIPRLSMVTIALFETLVDLNCEDVMLELCFGALAPCSHVMLSQRRNLLHELDPFGRCAEKFLSLAPNCCSICVPAAVSAAPAASQNTFNQQQQQQTLASNSNSDCGKASLYSNYYAYLRDARQKIASCQQACDKWSSKYEQNNEQYLSQDCYADDDWEDDEDKNDDDNDDEDEQQQPATAGQDTDDDISLDSSLQSHLNQQQLQSSEGNESVIRRSSTDEKVDKILASFTGKSASFNGDQLPAAAAAAASSSSSSIQEHRHQKRKSIDSSLAQQQDAAGRSSSSSKKRLGPAERERLEADIAALLAEVVDNKLAMSKVVDDDTKYPTTIPATESNSSMASNSLQWSQLSGAESSGYESFAPIKRQPPAADSTLAKNDDFDADEKCSSSTEPPTAITTSSSSSSSCSSSSHHQFSMTQSTSEVAAVNSIQARKRRAVPLKRPRSNRGPTHSNWKQRQQLSDGVDTVPIGVNQAEQQQQQQQIGSRPPSVGIFLDILLKKLEYMTENSVYVNLHLTGLISRLAIYPQPLLQSFLLNHSLVFQPSIKSLFQVLASLKNRIDGYLSKQQQDIVSVLTEHAKIFLINRESRLVNVRKNMLEAAAQFPSPKKYAAPGELVASAAAAAAAAASSVPTVSTREPKRRSLTSSLTQMFKKSTSSQLELQAVPTTVTRRESAAHADSFSSMLPIEEQQGSKDAKMRISISLSSWESPNVTTTNRLQNVVLCAVILGEWLKELAAITQEHTIVSWFNAAANIDHFDITY